MQASVRDMGADSGYFRIPNISGFRKFPDSGFWIFLDSRYFQILDISGFWILDISGFRIFPDTGYFRIPDISGYRIFPDTGYFWISDISRYRIFPEIFSYLKKGTYFKKQCPIVGNSPKKNLMKFEFNEKRFNPHFYPCLKQKNQ